jgi:hypothetical protein
MDDVLSVLSREKVLDPEAIAKVRSLAATMPIEEALREAGFEEPSLRALAQYFEIPWVDLAEFDVPR